MPYKTTSDLPDPVKKALPSHAQDLYLTTFNHAWEEYESPQKRATPESREEISHKVAWSAVKKKYAKTGGS